MYVPKPEEFQYKVTLSGSATEWSVLLSALNNIDWTLQTPGVRSALFSAHRALRNELDNQKYENNRDGDVITNTFVFKGSSIERS